MKRILTFVLLIAVAAVGFSQTTGLESVLSDTSFGVFGNELDAALTVTEAGNRPVFSDLVNKMVFGGLSNLNLVEADATHTATAGNPFWAGMFLPGNMPFSLFLGMFYDGAAGNQDGGTTTTSTAKNGIVVGTTTTNYEWISQSVETNYTANRIFDNFQKDVQFIMPFGGINVGLGLQLALADASPQANNYTQTETNNYDTALAAVAPTPTLDYTYSATETDLDKTTTIGLSVPIFLRTGEMGHTVQVDAGFTRYNQSSSFSESYTDPADAAIVDTVTEADNVTNKFGLIELGADYDLVMPGQFSGNEANELMLGAGLGATLHNGQYSTVLTEQDRTWAGGGAAVVLGTRNDDSTTDTLDGGMDILLDLSAAHSFYHDMGEAARFGLIPDVAASVSLDNEDWLVASDTEINRVDVDGNGVFTDAADTITTTTNTYTNTAYDPFTLATGDSADELVIRTEFGLAGSVQVTPGEWPFSVTLGSRPRLVMTNTMTTTRTAVTSTNTSTVDGAGNPVGNTVVDNAPASDKTSSWSHGFLVDAQHQIALSMMIAQMIRVDVALNLSTAINILDFRDLTIQAIVKLP